MVARTLGPDGRWIVMFYIGWGGEQITGCGNLSLADALTLRGSPKRTISASGVINGIRARHQMMCQPSRCSSKGGRHKAVCQ